MREVTREQSHAVMAILAQNVDWSALDMDVLQNRIVRNPFEAGVNFTAFLKNGGDIQWVVKNQLGKFWKLVKVGGRKADELVSDILSAGMFISDYAKDVMRQKAFTTSAEVKELRLVRVPLRDWFKHEPTTDEIFAEAEKRGLRKLPAETALHLRLEYKDQPENEWLVIGHEPIVDSGGRPSLLCLDRGGGGLWFGAGCAGPGGHWRLGGVFVFLASQD